MVRRAAEAGGERRGEAGRQGEAPEAEVGGERRGEAGRQSEAPEADSGGTQAESGEARLGGKARHRRRGQAESVARGGGRQIQDRAVRIRRIQRVRSKLPALV